MLMTEDEAKTKWCPFARQHPSDPRNHEATGNRWENGYPSTPCLAAGCMAWRQAQKRLTLPSTESPGHARDGWVSSPVQPFDDGDGTHRLWENDRAGFCGLAGSP